MSCYRGLSKCCMSETAVVDDGVDDAYDSEDRALDNGFVEIKRKVLTKKTLDLIYPNKEFTRFEVKKSIKKTLRESCKCSKSCLKKQLYNRIPSIQWLKNYKIKSFLLADLVAGLVVGVMHIPFGLALSNLAGLPPVYGLYVSFFPGLIYWIFGTSRQISIGTDSIIALMVSASIKQYSPKFAPPENYNPSLQTNIDTSKFLSNDRDKARVLFASAQMFWVGIIQLAMFVMRLGFLSIYLPETLIAAFTSATAIHIGSAQLKNIFGIKLTEHVGIFKIPKTYYELFSRITETNYIALIISVVAITFLLVLKIHVNERFQKKLPVPIPGELFVIVIGTIISYFVKLNSKFGVMTVGKIPSGLPNPTVPPIWIIGDIYIDTLAIAIISFSMNFSIADVFSKKYKYKINPSQELFAYGASNLFGSFFSCFTTGGSLSRSSVQDSAGGKTQIVAIISAILIAVVLVAIGPLFETLPLACLAAIIVSALKNLLLQITRLPYYWKVNKIEFFLWVNTYLSVVILDVDVGLGIGVALYIASYMFRSSAPYASVLGNLPQTEIYKDVKLYRDARERPGIKIIRFEDSLYASNAAYFKKTIYRLTGVKPQDYIDSIRKIMKAKKKKGVQQKSISQRLVDCFTFVDKDKEQQSAPPPPSVIANNTVAPVSRNVAMNEKTIMQNLSLKSTSSLSSTESSSIKSGSLNSSLGNHNPSYLYAITLDNLNANRATTKREPKHLDQLSDNADYVLETTDYEDDLPVSPIHHIIIDCSTFNYVDSIGVQTIIQMVRDYDEINVKVYLAECNDSVYHRFKQMERANSEKDLNTEKLIHVTLHDAVIHAVESYRESNVF